MLDNFDDLEIPEDEEISDSDSNRSFLMVAGGIGGLIVIALLMMAAYVFFLRPDPAVNQPVDDVDNSQLIQQATEDALNEALTGTAIAMAFTPVVTNTPVPPTATEVVVEVATEEPLLAPTQDPRTATVEALLTQASMAQTQAVLITLTPTALPDEALPITGFLDDFGTPVLAGLALLMIIIIFTARRLRQENA